MSSLNSIVDILFSGSLDCSNVFFRADMLLIICDILLEGMTYAGSIEVIVLPLFAFTNSLLMNRPVGWLYLRPFGAVSASEDAGIADRCAREQRLIAARF